VRETGRGDYLDVAMLDSTLAWTPNVTGRIFATHTPHIPKEERSWGGNAMYNLYECADGKWLALGGAELKFAINLLEALGRPDLIAYAKLEPGLGQEPLRSYFCEIFKTKSLPQWLDWLADKDVAYAPVNNLKEAFDDSNTHDRDMLFYDGGKNEVVGTPLKFQEQPARLDTIPPRVGEHADILLQGLGYSNEEITTLRETGII